LGEWMDGVFGCCIAKRYQKEISLASCRGWSDVEAFVGQSKDVKGI